MKEGQLYTLQQSFSLFGTLGYYILIFFNSVMQRMFKMEASLDHGG